MKYQTPLFAISLTIFATILIFGLVATNLTTSTGGVGAYPPGNNNASTPIPDPYPVAPTPTPLPNPCPHELLAAIELGMTYSKLKNAIRLNTWINSVNTTQAFNDTLLELGFNTWQAYRDALLAYTGSNRVAYQGCFGLDSYLYLPIIPNAPHPKKGFAYSQGAKNYNNIQDTIMQFGGGWYFNWRSRPRNWDPVGINFEHIPMVWCDLSNDEPPVDLLQESLNDLGADYDGYLLFLNEPNLGAQFDQCRLKLPVESAAFFLEVQQTFPDAKLIGPHLFHNEAGDFHAQAMAWVENWRNAVIDLNCPNDPNPDPLICGPNHHGYGIHPYAEIDQRNIEFVQEFYQKIHAWPEAANAEIWITEFGYCLPEENDPNPEEPGEFTATTILAWDADPNVTRYAYYSPRKFRPANEISTHPGGVACGYNHDLYDPLDDWETLSITGNAYKNPEAYAP